MLPKAKRLSKNDFLNRPLRSLPFLFGSIKLLEGEPKAAVVVSKKVARHAVTRNLLRRRMYSIIRSLPEDRQLRRRIIIYPNKAAVAAPFQELKKELERALAHC